MNIKLIAMDIDGTLLDDNGRIPEENSIAIKRAYERGVHVVLSSGRMTARVLPFAEKLGIDSPVISYNGAMARLAKKDGFGVIYHNPLPADIADELIEYSEKQNRHLNYYLDDVLYAKDSPDSNIYAEMYSNQTGSVFHFVPTLRKFNGKYPTKLIIIVTPDLREKLHDEFSETMSGRCALMKTNPEYLEFLNLTANKGSALEKLADTLGLPIEQTLAIGDGENDIPLLKSAGVSVAVKNAKEKLKEVADYFTERTNNESAVAEVINRFLESG